MRRATFPVILSLLPLLGAPTCQADVDVTFDDVIVNNPIVVINPEPDTGTTTSDHTGHTGAMGDTGDTDVTGSTGDTGLNSTTDTAEPCVMLNWYTDADGDGVNGAEQIQSACESPGPEWNNTEGLDCDDLDSAVWTETFWTVDLDNDLHGDPDSVTRACHAPSVDHQSDILLADDCDDLDPLAWTVMDWSMDLDGDGHADPLSLEEDACGSPGPDYGLYAAVDDCDDQDPTVWTESYWAVDLDNDLHSDPATVIWACNAPSVDHRNDIERADDCDDTRDAAHPGAVEDDSNGEDDDCDGVTDECDTDSRRDTFIFDTESVVCTGPVLSLQRYDQLGRQTFGSVPNGTMLDIVDDMDEDGDGVEDFTVTVIGTTVTVESLRCVPMDDRWYFSGKCMNGAVTAYSCMGDDLPDGDHAEFGSLEHQIDGVDQGGEGVGYEFVNNYHTPTNSPGAGPGCEATEL